MITRVQVLKRAHAIHTNTIPYSQTRISDLTARRSDCSGWISYCWNTPRSGPGIYLAAYNTASLVTEHVIQEIPFSDLKPGDAIGYCSPNSPGNGGHIALWIGRSGPDWHHVLDHGSGLGPSDRYVKWNGSSTGWLHPNHLKAWRYVNIQENTGVAMFCKYGDNGDVVRALQLAIVRAGGTLPKYGVDGDYGNEVASALAALIGGDGKNFGPEEYDKLYALAYCGIRRGQGVTLTGMIR